MFLYIIDYCVPETKNVFFNLTVLYCYFNVKILFFFRCLCKSIDVLNAVLHLTNLIFFNFKCMLSAISVDFELLLCGIGLIEVRALQ